MTSDLWLPLEKYQIQVMASLKARQKVSQFCNLFFRLITVVKGRIRERIDSRSRVPEESSLARQLVGVGVVDGAPDGATEGPAVLTPPVFCLCFPLTPVADTCSGTEKQWAAVTEGSAVWTGSDTTVG